MLQFFDDLPHDRWAAFLHVEQHARQTFLRSPRVGARRKYMQMVLLAAHELELLILPDWQSVEGLLHHIAVLSSGLDGDEKQRFSFLEELEEKLPKIALLAKRGTELRRRPYKPLNLDEELS